MPERPGGEDPVVENMREDPVLLHDAAAALFGDLSAPRLGQSSYTMYDGDDVFLALSPEDLKGHFLTTTPEER